MRGASARDDDVCEAYLNMVFTPMPSVKASMNVISGEITSIWKRYTESTTTHGQDTVYDNDSELFRYRPEKT